MIDIMNLSLSIGNDSAAPPKELVPTIGKAIADGVIVIVAAGNCGPKAGTMNRLAQLKGIISVGSASWDGSRLSKFSSRGKHNQSNSGPTLVAPGEDLIGGWTSEKAKNPDQIERDKRLITLVTLKRQTGRSFAACELDRIRQSSTVMSGTSQACAYISGLLGRFIAIRKALSLPYGRDYAVEFLKRSSRTMSGYGSHEQGLGFVSSESILSYLQSCKTDDAFWCKSATSLEDAWLSSTGAGVKIAIIDTGRPKDPKYNVVASKDFTNSPSGEWDENGHSTHISGIIGG